MDTQAPTARRDVSKDRFKLAHFSRIRPVAPTLLSTSLDGAAAALHANVHGVLPSRLHAPASSLSLPRPPIDRSLESFSSAHAPDGSSAAPLPSSQGDFPPNPAGALRSDHATRAAADGEPRLAKFLPPPPPASSAVASRRAAGATASPLRRAIAGRSASLPESASPEGIGRAAPLKRWLSSPSLPLVRDAADSAVNSQSDGRQQSAAQAERDCSPHSRAAAVASVRTADPLCHSLPPAATQQAPRARAAEGVLRRQRSLPQSITCR
ncbi:hypothetical protein CLOM_g7525 [Closterium sp. NIES-68]|nr:hypothetical protein CLOM_g7525 [Closterium sp. NIES-68]GJP80366.1 hypothetical protein CLOP_g10575 [Closterium sp. NIES-67]